MQFFHVHGAQKGNEISSTTRPSNLDSRTTGVANCNIVHCPLRRHSDVTDHHKSFAFTAGKQSQVRGVGNRSGSSFFPAGISRSDSRRRRHLTGIRRRRIEIRRGSATVSRQIERDRPICIPVPGRENNRVAEPKRCYDRFTMVIGAGHAARP